MNAYRRRLDDLEARTGHRAWTADDEAHFRWLSSSSLVIVLGKFADLLAERRYLHLHGDGWDRLDERQRANRAAIERDAFAALLRTCEDPHGAIRRWLAEPDTESWPALYPWLTMDYDAFTTRLTHERATLAVHRGADSPHGIEWRRRHPAWRPDFTPDQYDRWEASLGTAWMVNSPLS